MRRFAVELLVIALLLVAMAGSGIRQTSSNAGDGTRSKRQTADSPARAIQKRISEQTAVAPLSYRSPGATHKLLIPTAAATADAYRRLARRTKVYGDYTLIEVTDAALAHLQETVSLSPQTMANGAEADEAGGGDGERAQLRDDWNLILLRRGQLDTTAAEPPIREDLRQPAIAAADAARRALHLVQLFGAPTPADLERLKASGAKIVSYIPNNAYLMYGSRAQLDRLRALRHDAGIVQWEAPFHPAYKLDPRLRLDTVAPLRLALEIVDTPEAAETLAHIKSLARQVLMDEFRAAGTIHIKILTESDNLASLIKHPEVIAVEPWGEIRLHDERANQIIAGVTVDETVNNVRLTRPANPGYLAFLHSLGFTGNFDFAVDLGDTGLDRGIAAPTALHSDFLDQAGNSRIAYLNDFTFTPTATPAHDPNGHGTINASIIGGYNVGAGSEFRDHMGYQYGLGVAPFVRLGVSRIFNEEGNFMPGLSYAQHLNLARSGGARISNNSWGICDGLTGFCNVYSSDSRAMDALVRDTDANSVEYQPMVLVFSAGNDGADGARSVSMPGTAKNVITVGASEGFRATGANGENLLDGCGVPGFGADNAQDIISFSSTGPMHDGRIKPDLVAPGTHITGAVTQAPVYATKPFNDIGPCDFYFPAGQTLYTWSSGTSHAAPMVSGGAALAFQWLRTRLQHEPSPALIKAFLLNATTYLSGRNAGGNLPSPQQGWGLLNLSRMFETTDRVIYDEAPERAFTVSGGAPFEITGVITDPAKEFRVMLAYTDAPGIALSNAPYVNQLNLEVVVGGVLYHGNVFEGQYSKTGGQADAFNNAQGVRLPAGTTGPFVIRVRPTVIAGDGRPWNGIDLDQDFALVVTNGRETPTPILGIAKVEAGGAIIDDLTVTHANGATDRALLPGETALIKIGVRNTSLTTAATVTQATLTLADTPSASQQSFPNIPANATAHNDIAFAIQVPANLRCGSVAQLRLQLDTAVGSITLPLRALVGRVTSPLVIFDDDVDSARVKWKMKKGFSVNQNVGLSGTRSYHAVDPGRLESNQQLSLLFTKKAFNIPANVGNVRLSFFHIFNFEPGFDGGVLEISTDDGVSWQDLGSRILVGGYDGVVPAVSENPLGDRLAWTSRGRAGVFSEVVVNLDDFAGQRIRLRFLAGFDGATGVREGYAGWFIDNIRLRADNVECR